MNHRTITILETPNGWVWKERGTEFRSAVNVLRSVKREDLKASRNGGQVSIIQWQPATDAGTVIVRSLQS